MVMSSENYKDPCRSLEEAENRRCRRIASVISSQPEFAWKIWVELLPRDFRPIVSDYLLKIKKARNRK